jgi:quinoprotein glucose dehydrogenase
MKRIAIRVVPAMVLIVAVYAWVAPLVSGQASPMPSTRNGEWPMYTADLRGSKYSPLDQINGNNFSKMEVAWRLKTDNFGPRPETKLEGTPIMVKGMLYATAGTRRAVVAMNPGTGEIKWTYSMDEGERATRWAPRQLSGRGLSYWTDGKGDERVIYVTTGYRLVSLDAKTGQPKAGFGQNGVVDLKQGIMINGKQADLEKSEIGLHSTPTVVGDVILVGSSMFEGLGYVYATNVQGQARAFDARTGKLLWSFHGIPKRGEFGFDTWKNESAGYTGNNGVWTQITADPELGLVYLPVETPTIDEYGGNRPGDNLFAESLVAVDLKTGVRKWHFQFVHHPLWDHDMSSAPLLIDTTIDGKPRKIVAVPSKQGWLYCFDRATGEPIWPIEERPVPQSTMKYEETAKTQPFPTKPVPYGRTYVAESDLIDFTPALRQQALANLKFFRWEPTPYVPPTGPESDKLGSINIANTTGNTNWPGAGFDIETGIFYSHAHNSAVSVGHYDEEEFAKVTPENKGNRTPRWEAEPNYGRPRQVTPGAPAAAPQINFPGNEGRRKLVEGLEGLPLLKPPYGVLSAIDLKNPDKLLFQVPHGDTPDNIKNHPLLKGMNIPKTGQPGNEGVLITKTMVVVGDPQVTTKDGQRGASVRAYNKMTGEQIGEVRVPAQVLGMPMTYMHEGRQYIVVGVSGGNYTGEYIAFRLPQSEVKPATSAGGQ